MSDFHLESGHIVPGRDIPELSPAIARKFTTGELDNVWIARGIKKLLLPRGAQCTMISGDHTEIHLSDRLRAEFCNCRALKGQEGSTLDINGCSTDELFVQLLRLRVTTRAGAYRPTRSLLSVSDQGLVGAILVQDRVESVEISGPVGPGKLKIAMMDRRHLTGANGNVEVMQFLSDREIAVKIGPLSGRQQRGPQDPPGEQRHQGRGYKP